MFLLPDIPLWFFSQHSVIIVFTRGLSKMLKLVQHSLIEEKYLLVDKS